MLINKHMEKLYNAIICTFENSVNTFYTLIRLKKVAETTCRRSPRVFATLGGDDSCEKIHDMKIKRDATPLIDW